MLPNQFRLSMNWDVTVVLKYHEFSVIISYVLYCHTHLHVQCTNPAELPTLVCSYNKVARNNVYYKHRMKMQWLLLLIMRMQFSRVSRKQRNSNLLYGHVEFVN